MQCLSRSLVEFACDGIEVLLTVDREVGAFREVLAQKAVGVFVGAALPRAVGIAEVDVEIGGQRQAFVIGKLLAAILGQRAPQFSRQMLDL